MLTEKWKSKIINKYNIILITPQSFWTVYFVNFIYIYYIFFIYLFIYISIWFPAVSIYNFLAEFLGMNIWYPGGLHWDILPTLLSQKGILYFPWGVLVLLGRRVEFDDLVRTIFNKPKNTIVVYIHSFVIRVTFRRRIESK